MKRGLDCLQTPTPAFSMCLGPQMLLFSCVCMCESNLRVTGYSGNSPQSVCSFWGLFSASSSVTKGEGYSIACQVLAYVCMKNVILCVSLPSTYENQTGLQALISSIFYSITSWWLPDVARVLNYPNPLSPQQHTTTNLYIYIKDYTTAIIWFPQQCESSKFPASHTILYAVYIYIYIKYIHKILTHTYSKMCTKFGWNRSRRSRVMLEHKHTHSFLWVEIKHS
jgi:hypothetical protein